MRRKSTPRPSGHNDATRKEDEGPRNSFGCGATSSNSSIPHPHSSLESGSLTLARQPPSAEPRATEAGFDVRTAPHEPPDEIGAPVLDHEQDRALIDTEVVAIEPAEGGI